MRDWRLIESWGASPGFNMGLDEALLLDADAPPTLRLYTWEPDTLSLGYFQRWKDVPGTETAGAVVRRLTGGGAIHHVNELTFSLTTSANDALYRGPVADSYDRVHAVIADVLGQYGAAARPVRDDAMRSDTEGTGMCFHKSTPQDLAWGGRKGVGSAQRRTKDRVLHHGSIKLASSPLEGSIASLADVGECPSAAELGARLADALARAFDWRLAPGAPSSAEARGAAELGARYSAPDFLHRR